MNATLTDYRSIIRDHQRRIWGLCYRMTGDRVAADDLAQESLARALERAAQVARPEGFEGWLYRVATTTCLDWLRRHKLEGRIVGLVDPLDIDDAPFASDGDPETTLLRREDLRLAILTTLRTLPPRQRAVLILRDVLDRSVRETAAALELSQENVKVLLHRARARLSRAHPVRDQDVPVDDAVVERFARAIERADLEQLIALLADDVWGIVDDGRPSRRPSIGRRAVSRQWQNALRRFGRPDSVDLVRLNGERAITVSLASAPFAVIHLETRGGQVAGVRVLRDPARIARLRLGS